jgi:hypothetical protein
MTPPCHCEERSDEAISVGIIEIATHLSGARNDVKRGARNDMKRACFGLATRSIMDYLSL